MIEQELHNDSTDLFQRNMLDRYLDQSCEFLSHYCIVKKPAGNSGNNSQPVLLDDTIMQSNNAERNFPKVVPLMTIKKN